jgi:hypothetical protein
MALTSLDISNNNIGQLVYSSGGQGKGKGKEKGKGKGKGGRGFGKGKGSGEHRKPEGAIAIANAIKDMRALSTFTFSGDFSNSEPVTMETTMTEAVFSGKALGVSGGMMVAAFLPKCQ